MYICINAKDIVNGAVRLGGDDFSDAILQWMLNQQPQLKTAPQSVRAELLAKADEIKQTLSHQPEAQATLEWNNQHLHWSMNEEQLAECCKALLTRLQRPVQQALQ